jgi:hypothetical protein
MVYAELLHDRAPAGRYRYHVRTAICTIFLFNWNQDVHALKEFYGLFQGGMTTQTCSRLKILGGTLLVVAQGTN